MKKLILLSALLIFACSSDLFAQDYMKMNKKNLRIEYQKKLKLIDSLSQELNLSNKENLKFKSDSKLAKSQFEEKLLDYKNKSQQLNLELNQFKVRIAYLENELLKSNPNMTLPKAGSYKRPITDLNIAQAVKTCLSTNPVDGMCSDSEYGAMPDWDVSNVTNMSNAFDWHKSFNGDISNWDVSNVTDMSFMFNDAQSFNQSISNWDVSSVTNMRAMFINADSFNQDISNWDVSNVTDMSSMFHGEIFMRGLGEFTKFNQPIGDWDVSNVTDMRDMFCGNREFNQPIGDWDVSNVSDMSEMFGRALVFNQDLSNWDVSNVEYCSGFSKGANKWSRKHPKPNFKYCNPWKRRY